MKYSSLNRPGYQFISRVLGDPETDLLTRPPLIQPPSHPLIQPPSRRRSPHHDPAVVPVAFSLFLTSSPSPMWLAGLFGWSTILTVWTGS